MAAPDVPALLSLAGHELRGPAGILGGYLRLLARDGAQLTDRQQQAVAAAERALARLVETLDELRDVQRWLAPERPATPVTPAVDLAAVLQEAVRHAPDGTSIDVHPCPTPTKVRGDRDGLIRAVAACLEAVAREHVPPVHLQVRPSVGRRDATVRIVARGTGDDAYVAAAADVRRGGLGLRLVLAAMAVDDAGGALHDLALDGTPAGIALDLPLYSS